MEIYDCDDSLGFYDDAEMGHDENDDLLVIHDFQDSGDCEFEPYLVHCLREGEWSDAFERIQTHSYETRWRGINNETVFMAAIANTMNLPVPLHLLESLKEECGIHILGECIHGRSKTACTCRFHSTSRGLQPLVNPLTLAVVGLADEVLTGSVINRPREFQLRIAVIERLLSWNAELVDTALPYLCVLWRRSHNSEKLLSSSMSSLTSFWMNIFMLVDKILYASIHRKADSLNTERIGTKDRNGPVAIEQPVKSQFLHRLLMVHARVFPLPSSLIQTAIELSEPHTCRELDSHNQTPLIVAISQIQNSNPASYGCTVTCNKHKKSSLHDIYAESNTKCSSEKTTSKLTLPILTLLSKQADLARITDQKGRLPLHLAIEQGQIWSDQTLQALISSEPRAIHTRDVQSKLYPFMQAAVGEESDMDTVFELLWMNPLLARGLLDKRKNKESGKLSKRKVRDDLIIENKKLRGVVSEQKEEITLLKEKMRLLERNDDVSLLKEVTRRRHLTPS